MAKNTVIDVSTKSTLVPNLRDRIKTCYTMVKPTLEKRLEILKEYENSWYDSTPIGKMRDKTPLNLVARSINTILPLLASKDPRAMVRPRLLSMKPLGETLRLSLNHVIDQIQLGETLRIAALESLVFMGIVKTGICPGGKNIADAFGVLHDSGQLFCDPIYPMDYTFDVSARRREEMDFEGNWFYVPAEYVLDDKGMYQNTDKLKETYQEWNKLGAESVAKAGVKSDKKTLKPYVRLCELWIPSEKTLITISEEGQGDLPLRVVDFKGPRSGPYDILSYMNFPESVIPIAPLYTSLDLHYFINTMLRKMARQANRNKQITIWEASAENDMKNIDSTDDGGNCKVANIDKIKQLETQTINEKSYEWVAWLKQAYSEQNNNLNVVGGIQQQAGTLGQEQMLYSNATVGIDDMVARGHSFIKSIMTKMTHYVLTDPLVDIRTAKEALNGEVEVPTRLVYGDIEAEDAVKYNIDVEPYSMQRVNPTLRMQRIMQLVTGVILPFYQQAMQSGQTVDVAALVKLVGRDLDLTDSEVDSIFKNVMALPNNDTGPYQMPAKMVGGDGSGQLASGDGARANNLNQQQVNSGGQSSPDNNSNGMTSGVR